MHSIEVLISLIPGILLVAFPNVLIPKTATAEEATKKKSKLRKIMSRSGQSLPLKTFLAWRQPTASLRQNPASSI